MIKYKRYVQELACGKVHLVPSFQKNEVFRKVDETFVSVFTERGETDVLSRWLARHRTSFGNFRAKSEAEFTILILPTVATPCRQAVFTQVIKKTM